MKPTAFKTETVLSLATGLSFVPQEDVIALVNFMHNQTVHYTRLAEAIELCKTRIGNEYSVLKNGDDIRLQINEMKGIFQPKSSEDMALIFQRHWLAAMKRLLGETIKLFPLPYKKLDLACPKI
ncbi:MAG TPA: hypothetical protein P5080_03675 [Candidatus Paceibacterota bacterium]|nr:hypothetical protein [Candidatus Pacearchaeota archaeon]HRZ51057.1 hypothetical protein [Candidatus Paceibacterota bacterium]HSA36784.1 hypothetical protein [Candidatus Paceibacterota bacterium]